MPDLDLIRLNPISLVASFFNPVFGSIRSTSGGNFEDGEEDEEELEEEEEELEFC